MSPARAPTERFRIYCRVHGLDPQESQPGTDYVRWIRRERMRFGSHARSDNEAFLAWLDERYPAELPL